MALDGIVIANIVYELNNKLIGARINKISQPEKDEILLILKSTNRDQNRLVISASATLPLVYFIDENKTNPLSAPNFCMLLRKHINGGKIVEIYQPNFERIINIKIECLDELGDLSHKYLIIELMGKHSNIIFCDSEFTIIDSIKRINHFVSSIRQVLPGKEYFIPQTTKKYNPLQLDFDLFYSLIKDSTHELLQFFYMTFNGISPLMAREIIYKSSLNVNTECANLSKADFHNLYNAMDTVINQVKSFNFSPNIVYDNNEPIEFASLILDIYKDKNVKISSSISNCLQDFYAKKDAITRIKQKSSDLRRVLNLALDRTNKKYSLQSKKLKDTEGRDKYKVYGELITTYGYNLDKDANELVALNYYTNKEISIPLNKDLSPIENAKKYFKKYSKLKRTFEALEKQIEETKKEILHLESIEAAMDNVLNEEDLILLRKELADYGYIKEKYKQDKKANKNRKLNLGKSKPIHYLSSDNFHIYVGKNNYQNDELTFKIAKSNDWWFHSKNIPGSHIIVRADGQALPEQTIEEAASLAAYYSSGRDNDKVEIDYTLKKHLKKPNGALPGFVTYNVYSSTLASTDISNIKEIKKGVNKI